MAFFEAAVFPTAPLSRTLRTIPGAPESPEFLEVFFPDFTPSPLVHSVPRVTPPKDITLEDVRLSAASQACECLWSIEIMGSKSFRRVIDLVPTPCRHRPQ